METKTKTDTPFCIINIGRKESGAQNRETENRGIFQPCTLSGSVYLSYADTLCIF